MKIRYSAEEGYCQQCGRWFKVGDECLFIGGKFSQPVYYVCDKKCLQKMQDTFIKNYDFGRGGLTNKDENN